MTTPTLAVKPAFLDRAEILTSRGIPIVPVNAGEKRCLLANWPERATTDPEAIKQWGEQMPDANTAAVCLPEGVCVLDCDAKDAMDRIQASGRELPETFTVRSAGRGLPHVYFKQTDKSRALGNVAVHGVCDFQQNRKYVVGPDSVLDGKTYEIVNDAELAPIPDWLCDWLAQNGVREQRGKGRTVCESFTHEEFHNMLDHYGITGDWDGNWFITEVCPIAGYKHKQSTRTGFYFDGERLGFHCFAAGCEGHTMTIGAVIKFLNRRPRKQEGSGITIYPAYDKPIWDKPEDEKAEKEKKPEEWRLVRFSSKTAKAIRWVWPGYLAEV